MKNKIILFAFLIFAAGVFTFACQSKHSENSIEIQVSTANTDAAEPAIAADSSGNIYVLYVEHGANKAADIFLRKFDGNAQRIGEEVRINPSAGGATAWRGDPPTIKIGADNTVYVGWTARVETPDGTGANDLCLSVSRDGGKNFDAPVKVNDDKFPAGHGMHALDVDKNGRIYFAWLDERYLKNDDQSPEQLPMDMSKSEGGEMKHQHGEPNREFYFAASTNNGKSFSANVKIAENVCPCCKVSMTTAPDGRFYVSWRQVLDGDYRHFAVSSSNDGGNTFALPTIVSDDQWQISACPVSGSSMIVDKNNNLKIIWYTAGTAGTPGIYQAESNDGGKSFSPRKLVSDPGGSGTPTILPDADGGSKIVFAGIDKNTYLLTEQNNSGNLTEQLKINDADLPAAAVANGKVYIAFIRKVNDKRLVILK